MTKPARPARTTARPQPQATSQRRDRATRPPQRPARRPARTSPLHWPMVLLMLAWCGVGAWAMATQRLPWPIAAGALVLNVATYIVYAIDKHAAQQGAWRTPENTLHLLALLGGWPAAWWAQQRLRHKSSKGRFQAVYTLTVLLHWAVLGWLLQGGLRHTLTIR